MHSKLDTYRGSLQSSLDWCQKEAALPISGWGGGWCNQVRPGGRWSLPPTQDALSSCWLPPGLLTSCTVPGSHPAISPQFKVQAISLILLPRDSFGP